LQQDFHPGVRAVVLAPPNARMYLGNGLKVWKKSPSHVVIVATANKWLGSVGAVWSSGEKHHPMHALALPASRRELEDVSQKSAEEQKGRYEQSNGVPETCVKLRYFMTRDNKAGTRGSSSCAGDHLH